MKDFVIKNKTVLIIVALFAIATILYIQYWVKSNAAKIAIEAIAKGARAAAAESQALITAGSSNSSDASRLDKYKQIEAEFNEIGIYLPRASKAASLNA